MLQVPFFTHAACNHITSTEWEPTGAIHLNFTDGCHTLPSPV